MINTIDFVKMSQNSMRDVIFHRWSIK